MEKKNCVNIVFVCLLCFGCLTSGGQAFSDFARLKIEPINNLNWKEANSQQVIPIKNLFRNNNIVILTENTHYDGAIRDAECMILKELIDAGTINTLYLERSWLDIDKINSILKEKGKDSIEETYQYCRSQLFMYWNNNGFWNYLANRIAEGKIEMIGFDIGGAKASIVQEFYKDALELPAIKAIYGNKNDDIAQLNNDSELFGFKYDFVFPKHNYLVQTNFIQAVIKEYSNRSITKKVTEWKMMQWYYDWVYRRQSAIKQTKQLDDLDKFIKEKTAYHSFRDSMMAEIFLEHYQSNKGVKAVAIMSAYHALNNFRSYPEIEKCCVDTSTHVMKEMLHRTIPDSIYSICFVAGSGEWGLQVDNKKNIYGKIKPDKKSIEYYFKKNTNYNWFYTDLKSANISASFPSAIIFNKTVCANWANIYQGLFFVREMYPTRFKSHYWDE
jgi:erythromycin esterase-like protein